MIKAVIAFKKAVAEAGFKKAVAEVVFKKAVADIKLGYFLITKFLFDTATAADQLVRSFVKSLSDSAIVSDVERKDVGKKLADQGSVADDQILNVGKVVNDAASTTDQIDTIAVGKNLSDSTVVSDALRYDFAKVLTDSVYATDDLDGQATAQDDQEMHFTKVRADLATVSDESVNSFGKQLSDTIQTSDYGSLRGQSYCSFDYFAEDYVGYSQSF